MKRTFLSFCAVFACAFVVIYYRRDDLNENRDDSLTSDRSAEFSRSRLDPVESNLGKRDHPDIVLGELSSQETSSKRTEDEIREDLTTRVFRFLAEDEEDVFSDWVEELPDILDRLLEKYGDDLLVVIVEMFGDFSAGAEADSEMDSRISQMERLIGQSLSRAISNGWIEDEVKLFNDILTKKGASGKIASHIVNQTYVAIGQSGDKELISRVFLNVCSASIKQDHHFSELAESAGASLGHEYALSLIPLDGRLGDYGTRTGISAIVQNWLVTDPIEASQFIKDAPDSAHRMIYIEEMVSYLARSGSIEEAKGWLEVLPEGSLNYLNANEAINESMEREKSKTQEIPEEQ